MEKDWVLVYTAGKAYKTTLLGEIFRDNDIIFDVINKKDSLLPIGEVEVYVNKKDEEKALALVKEFNI